jgi:hypothetical protein
MEAILTQTHTTNGDALSFENFLNVPEIRGRPELFMCFCPV